MFHQNKIGTFHPPAYFCSRYDDNKTYKVHQETSLREGLHVMYVTI